MKEVDVDQVLADLPDLASLKAVASTGPFIGCPYTLASNGRWRTNPGGRDFSIRGITRDDVELTCELGKLTLSRPTVTRHEFPGGEVVGSTVAVHLETGKPSGAARPTFRTYVRVDPEDWSHVFFPDSIEDRRGGGARTLLPLVGDAFEIDIYFLRQGPYLIFESSRADLTLDEFRRWSGAARQLFSYLTGEPCDRDSSDVVIAEDQVVEAWWYQGRTSEHHFYHPIPATLSEADLAYRTPERGPMPMPLKPAVLSLCLAKVLEHPALIAPIEYLMRFGTLPVEMRGAFLSVALESLTAHFQKQGLVTAPNAVDPSAWTPLRERLKAVLEEESGTWSAADQARVSILAGRIDGLNSPTNKDKLLRPFATFNIVLTAEEQDAIVRRNTYLHKGRLLDPQDVTADPESWRRAYEVEMRIYTAINKLLLKYLGYQGPVIDWGAPPTSQGKMAFTTI